MQRSFLGKELGLNTDLSKLDPYSQVNEKGQIFNKKLSKWLFLQVYEDTNRLITAIKNMLDSQEYDAGYHDFLLNMVKARGIEDPANYVAEHFYDENYKLNPTAINFMLKCIGILK